LFGYDGVACEDKIVCELGQLWAVCLGLKKFIDIQYILVLWYQRHCINVPSIPLIE